VNLAQGVIIDDKTLEAFCRANGIRRLRLFGSALGEKFNATSDIDLLVDFLPGRVPGLLRLSGLELELERLLGREVDLRTLGDLSRYIRDRVAAESRLLYDAA
jgi:hypothetical protein